jgi:NAD(P)-dependent dehydrogenase (short-subunit alcohol dehydrogenase family)
MADIGFDNRVAIVTGAGGGLGRCHALELARRGARLVINDLGGAIDGSGSDATPAEKVVAEIEALGGEAVANGDSVATPEGGAAIVAAAIDAFGRVDVVVNNAGILRDKTFHKMEPADVDAVIDVHLKGAFNVTRPAWVHMRDQGYGRIVMTASNAGVLGNFGQTNYGAAKMGLVGMANVLALEGAKYGIKVNVIAPVARTRMTEDLLGPLAAKLNPEQISPVVAWLASEECPVSGEVYSCGGGVVARFFVGLTTGYFNPALSVEDIRDHWDELRDQTGYDDFPDNSGEIRKLARLLRD